MKVIRQQAQCVNLPTGLRARLAQRDEKPLAILALNSCAIPTTAPRQQCYAAIDLYDA